MPVSLDASELHWNTHLIDTVRKWATISCSPGLDGP